VVKHHPRRFGHTKFGLSRFINGFLDLLTITFIFRFGKKPMHFFGGLGTIMFVVGFLCAGWVVGEKLWYSFVLDVAAPRVTSSGLFFVALTAMVIGVQLFTAGFVADLVSRNGEDRNRYRVSERIGL
jgi:hypothetical protein